MSAKSARSLQDILRDRQQEEFVGREEQLALFQANLGYHVEDPRRSFIINVHGQGGVGKTWLLRRFQKIAQEAGAIAACTDESEEDVPIALGHFASHFEDQGYALETFAERYKVYRKRQHEIETDPEAPRGFAVLFGRTLAKGSLTLARQVPYVGLAAGVVDEEAVADLGGEFADYVTRKFQNKKDVVRLVLEPVETLTPLFLADLGQIAEERTIALFFDTYERTGAYLDVWLRGLLEGRFGTVPSDIVFVIAGRHELEPNHWSPYEGALTRFPLDPFTEAEVSDYLARKKITSEQVVDVILTLSGRLPLLVATLATESPDKPEDVGTPSGEAVARFLKWIDNPLHQQVALDAALPRKLNRDVLAVLVGEEEAGALFAWLRGRPFVESFGEGWAYHAVVREQMLRHKHRESPQDWANVHGRLADYYADIKGSLGLDEKAGCREQTWQMYALEELYHRLCQAPQAQLTMAINGFLMALDSQHAFARRWAEAAQCAGEDCQAAQIQQWGQRLLVGMRAFDEERHEDALKTFTQLIAYSGLEDQRRAVAFAYRGLTCLQMERYEEALIDFGQAIELDVEYSWAIGLRGIAYGQMKHYEEALVDLDRAIELHPDNVAAIVSRGITNRLLARYEEATADFRHALELRPNDAWSILNRGMTHRLLEHFEEAIADCRHAIDLDTKYEHRGWKEIGLALMALQKYAEGAEAICRALEAEPACVGCWTLLAQAYAGFCPPAEIPDALRNAAVAVPVTAAAIGCRAEAMRRLGHLQQALAEFDRAIALDKHDIKTIVSRGLIYRQVGRCDEALIDFDHAIKLDGDNVAALANRGRTYRQLGRYEEALADFDRAIELDENNAQAFASRGILYRQTGRSEEALADFDHAIKLDGDNVAALANRGRTYRQLGRYEEALADFDRAIEFDENNAQAFASRGITYVQIGRHEEALIDFDHAIKLDGDNVMALANRGRTYRQLGRYEEALADFDHAIELDEHDAQTFASRGILYRQTGRSEEALADFDHAIKLDGDNVMALANRGRTYGQLGRYENALADFDRTIELDGDNVMALANRGQTYGQLGRYEDALADLDHAIELDKDNAMALAYRAMIYQRLGDYEKALAGFNQAIDLDEDMRSTLANDAGLVLSYLGRYEKAIERYEEEMEPLSHYALYNIAVAKARWQGASSARAEIAASRAALQPLLHTDAHGSALYGIAGLAAVEGDTETALHLLEEALMLEAEAAFWVQTDVAWLALREDPRFRSMIQSQGLQQ